MSEPEIIGTNTDETIDESNVLSQWSYFPTMVYSISKPEFLDQVKAAANRAMPEQTDLNDIYPVRMSDNIFNDEEAKPFIEYVGQTAWNILQSQGYNMDNYNTYFTECWQQEHHRHSLMEQHTHAHGVQLVGFYFLETPEDCSRLMIHDPRPAKVQINLPQANESEVTVASDAINFKPEPGLLMFTNAWLQHSFGRHASDDPIRFIHFNIGVQWAPKAECPLTAQAEVI